MTDIAADEHRRAVATFLRAVRRRYDVAHAILFGSRARGDYRQDSDLDLAVVLNGERGDFIETKLDMAGLAFDALLQSGILVQPYPLWAGDLEHPERARNPALIEAIVRDGVTLG